MATFSDIRSRLDTELNDTANVAFTSDQKDEAVNRAIEDEQVFTLVEDSSVTTVFQQRSYALDASYKAVFNVGIDSAGDGFPSDIPAEGWEFKAPNLIIKRRYMNLPAGAPLYIDVAKKLTASDDIPQPLENFVLELGILMCQEFLTNIKVARFLKNDTTMGELVARMNLAEQRVQRMRRSLRNQRGIRQ